jgi:hypothetical protein
MVSSAASATSAVRNRFKVLSFELKILTNAETADFKDLRRFMRFSANPRNHCLLEYNRMKRIWTALTICLLLLPAAVESQTCKDSILATTPDADFILHTDGTATDKTSGLMWMRCSLGQSWDGKTCRGQAVEHSWRNGLRAAVGFQFAGYSDWRVPNKNELESIIEERCATPAVNAAVFPNTPSAYFWSSSPYAGLAHGAWSIDFGYGSVNATAKSGGIHVRLVRGE